MNGLGYTKNLFILPFDHRSSFVKDMFGITNKDLTSQQIQQVLDAKETIYRAFKKAVEEYVPKTEAAILVDEQFGDKILLDAKRQGFLTLLTIEKSGQKEFTFEYGNEFAKHIEKYRPTFAKALIRYNPEAEKESKVRQQQNLKILSDYCHSNEYKFLLEVLIPPRSTSEEPLRNTSEVAARTPRRWTPTKGDSAQKSYDRQVRPKLAVKVIEELQNADVEPDVWKLEGSESEKDYQAIVNQAQVNGRDKVGIVVLGRGESKEKIEKWIAVGAKVKGVIGFAVGRTVFWDPLTNLKNGKIGKKRATEIISDNFLHFYDIFIENSYSK